MNYNSHDSFKNMIFNQSGVYVEENLYQDTSMNNNTMIIHEENKNSDQKKSKIRQRNSASRSMFMKMGKFLREPIEDPMYAMSNFEADKITKTNKKLNIIGSGAFGDVYTARNKIDGKIYAIKRMHKTKILESGQSLDIVHREISIHTRLIHENIVRAYSHHEDKDYIYLVLEHVNSGTLFELIKNGNGMEEKKAFKYFIQTVSAVNFLHDNNLIHRDLKPENLLLDQNENLKLCDFGWCIDIKDGHRITFCGTYEYMAPEMYQQLPYDFSIDVWTLGILLYELIHGYSPFRASDRDSADESEEKDCSDEIYDNIVSNDLKFVEGISENCLDLVKKLLTPNSKKRIKMKEIFSHPWIIDFEKELKQEKIKRVMSLQQEKIYGSNTNSYSNQIEDLIEKNESIVNLNNHVSDIYRKENLKVNLADRKNSKIAEKIQIFENKNTKINFISKVNNEKPVKLSSQNDPSRPPRHNSGSNISKKDENFPNMKKDKIEVNKTTTNTTKETYKSRHRSCSGNIIISQMKEKPNDFLHSNSIIIHQSDKDNLFDIILDRIHDQNCSKRKKIKSLHYSNNTNWENSFKINSNSNINMNSSKRNLEEVNPISQDVTLTGIYDKLKSNYDDNYLLEENIYKRKKSEFSKNKISQNFFENEFSDKKHIIRNESFNFDRPSSVIKFKKIDTDTNSIYKNYRNFSALENSGKNVDLSRELDLSFVPKDLLYNENSYSNSAKNLISAIETLEQAQIENRKKVVKKPQESFWDFLNPFKCGKDD